MYLPPAIEDGGAHHIRSKILKKRACPRVFLERECHDQWVETGYGPASLFIFDSSLASRIGISLYESKSVKERYHMEQRQLVSDLENLVTGSGLDRVDRPPWSSRCCAEAPKRLIIPRTSMCFGFN
jgi:hypothetical protein